MIRTVPASAAALLLLAGCAAPSASPSPSAPVPEPTPVPTASAEASASAAPSPGPGVSLDVARDRAATLSDVRYDLALDLTRAEDGEVPGRATLRFRRAADAGDLVVDFRGTALDSVSVDGDPLEGWRWEGGHVVVPAGRLRDGENELGFRFTAAAAAAGAPVIRVHDDADGATYLYTLLVPADAHALFPSFDQPDLKGRFRVSLRAPEGWTVIANGPVEAREPDGAAVVWRFAETEPISTYLAAFAAGPWHAWPTESTDPPATLYARASIAPRVDADTLLERNLSSARWLAEYFGVAFPFAKMDVVIAPAFPFGGMEHVGAIFYNEDRFVFREPPTLNRRLARDATTHHEVAHQWFGDLVTMVWFDDLWLKEGFSTYMAARMQSELDPDAEAWKTFYLNNKPRAYATDATAGTTPVWQELAHLDLAKSNYGPIVYNKAPGVLKQLRFLVGEEAFRAGVRLFLERHAYGNADWRDLLAAVEEASGRSLERFGEQYVLRAGLPVVRAELETEGGRVRRLALAQRPAREMPGDPGGWWPGRVLVRLAYDARDDVVLPVDLDGATTVVEAAEGLPAPDWVWANDGDHGYGVFLLDPASRAAVAERVGMVEDGLLRAMLHGALWDAVREGEMPPDEWLAVARRTLPFEEDEPIAGFVLDRAGTALLRYLDDERRATLLPPWERLLLERASDDALAYGLRKASLDAWVDLARSPASREALRGYLAEERSFAGEPVPQPTRWAMVGRLVALGAADADSLRSAEAARDTTPDAARNAFVAGAAVPDAAAKAALFRRFFDDADLNEAWVTASLGAFNDPAHAEATRPLLRPALERLEWIRENRRIFFLPQWVDSFLGGRASPEALAEVDAWLAAHPDLPADLRRKVLQARDGLERAVRIRSGERPAST